MNIYVGNLFHEVTEEDLRQAFEAFGQVESAKITKDKYSGESKGFGFVQMPAKAEAQSAIEGLNGKELKGRMLKVSEAHSRSERPRDGRMGGEMKDLIAHIAKALVDKPEEVVVTEIEGQQTSVIELKVAKEDLGKVIGRQGHTAQAIRTILNAGSKKIGKRSILELIE
ncbi:MAG: KH domain-containing protein [Desulfobacterales bacterium]|nr:KH domain-containing protein [Desulfobacterales bacterium]